MKNKGMFFALLIGVFAAGIAVGGAAAKKEMVITPVSEVKWLPLHPELLDGGAQYSMLFGDLKKKAPAGVLLKYSEATGGYFMHTHSSDYYGIEIFGTSTTTEPGQAAAAKALPPGSTWYVPAKLTHAHECPKGDCEMFVYFPNGYDFTFTRDAGMSK